MLSTIFMQFFKKLYH